MPRPKGIPAYKLHKASGQARVIILDGRLSLLVLMALLRATKSMAV